MNNFLSPRQALNKAFLKLNITWDEIGLFREHFLDLFQKIESADREESCKNFVRDFLNKIYYDSNHFISIKKDLDFVIYTGKNDKCSIGVIAEFKHPNNKAEMPKIDQLNVKSLQQLLLYFLQERITHKNLEIKHLIVSNCYEWFIFDAQEFERLFINDKNLVKQFTDYTEGGLSIKDTKDFYKDIAKPAIAAVESDLEFTYFDLRNYQGIVEKATVENSLDETEEKKLIELFKIFSPEHLLKLPFVNDSNSLNKEFYNELLHIIGLTEIKQGSKKLIERKPKKNRNSGSLLESAIRELENLGKLSRLIKPECYGETTEERLFNVALELVITWVNRILFLKLLEGQLIRYHKDDESFGFLNIAKIKNFTALNLLFFSVLARQSANRPEVLQERFPMVPYLNSSLFEPTDLEMEMIVIGNLNGEVLPVFPTTVLKDRGGQRLTGQLDTLQYLFDFLNAYNFGSDGSGGIQKESKSLINAAVLGLIFEKINGYKDGSFFTPGFITMYMCRETIRRAIVQKFNEVKNWNCATFNELKEDLDSDIKKSGDRVITRNEANKIINSLKICDPAVGSGHFLVSALNEIIAIKQELGILQDKTGQTLSRYEIKVENDELAITNSDGDFFEYNPKNTESQRFQETLFHEKQTLIEGCLFGVDINENSVKICQLRLWIELLKNAYYRTDKELETLPNIDINIKRGNSLISRFPLDGDLGAALRKNNLDVVTYRNAVQTYRNAINREQKWEMVKLIESIKGNFKTTLFGTDPNKTKLRQLEGEVYNLENQTSLFEESKADKKAREKKIVKLNNEIDKLKADIEEVESGRLYENALEWRFEFPEVLNNQGDFLGFDVIIGNPPYVSIQDLTQNDKNAVSYYRNIFQSAQQGNFDIYILFLEKLSSLTTKNSASSLILPSKFLTTDYGQIIRQYLLNNKLISEIVDFESYQVFDMATTYTCIVFIDKQEKFFLQFFKTIPFKILEQEAIKYPKLYADLLDRTWIFDDNQVVDIVAKIKYNSISLKDIPCKMSRGSSTGNDKIFVLTENNNKLINGYGEEVEIETNFLIKPIYATDFNRYLFKSNSDNHLIFPYDSNSQNYQLLREDFIKVNYPKAYQYFLNNQMRLQQRKQSNIWYAYSAARSLKNHLTADILVPVLADRGVFTLNLQDSQYTLMAGGGFSINVHNKAVDKRFLLALLNSKLLFFVLCRESNKFRGGYITCTKQYFENLPIKIVSPTSQQSFIRLVDQILITKKSDRNADTTTLEQEIDRLVYELYGLTEEEIAIIENS